MFFDVDIKGPDLPRKTLCLTYDDGPGETEGDGPGARTTELAHFLCDAGIPATFFVVGRHANRYPESIAALHRLGHAIGNHTYSHPGLVAHTQAGGDPADELKRTDAVLRSITSERPIFFRAPYGNWRQVNRRTGRDYRRSIVAARLNRSPRLAHYIGPINWDISAEDFAFWGKNASPADAADAYLRLIEQTGRGIVLLHDSSAEPALRRRNRTLELTMLLVPALLRRGYRFVPLTQVPRIKQLLATRNREPAYVGPGEACDGGHDYA
jgi:peptidoglycan/xylan/chitin deacetylase (PgdA/CDA1 family)